MSKTPAELVEKAQQGDCDAFEQLVEPYLGGIRRIAYAFCPRRADADDLAQEALLKAYRSIGSFRGHGAPDAEGRDGAFGAWLFAVTRSVCRDGYRRDRARRRADQVELDEERDVTEQASAEDLLQAKAQGELLWAAIRSLDARFRVPLVLFDIEGLSYQDIARIERTPVGTVRSRLARARDQLRAALHERSLSPSRPPEPAAPSGSSSPPLNEGTLSACAASCTRASASSGVAK